MEIIYRSEVTTHGDRNIKGKTRKFLRSTAGHKGISMKEGERLV